MLLLCIVLIVALIFITFDRYLIEQVIKSHTRKSAKFLIFKVFFKVKVM